MINRFDKTLERWKRRNEREEVKRKLLEREQAEKLFTTLLERV